MRWALAGLCLLLVVAFFVGYTEDQSALYEVAPLPQACRMPLEKCSLRLSLDETLRLEKGFYIPPHDPVTQGVARCYLYLGLGTSACTHSYRLELERLVNVQTPERVSITPPLDMQGRLQAFEMPGLSPGSGSEGRGLPPLAGDYKLTLYMEQMN